MLHTVGFPDVKIVHRDTVARRVGRAIKWKVRDRGYRVLAGVQQGRMVFHGVRA